MTLQRKRDYTRSIMVIKRDCYGLDYVLEFEEERDIRILQLTDTQTIDSSQRRTPDRICDEEINKWVPENMNKNLFDEMDHLVSSEKPDLILFTGDIIYGEFDDAGTSLDRMIEKLDSYEIPWAPIWGNHDNESKLGVTEQCRRIENAKNSLFVRREEIGGNGNYTIGISISGVLKRVIFMMDSNGCGNISEVPEEEKQFIKTEDMFHESQIEWYKKVAKINDVPSFLCFHLGAKEVSDALVEKGYQTTYDTYSESEKYDLGDEATEKDGTFGLKVGSSIYTLTEHIYSHLQEVGTDGVFMGHIHAMSISIVYKDIRWTYGLKTGTYDSHPKRNGIKATGGTRITLKGNDFDVKHIVESEI